jgi:hypothetical protein
MPKLKWKIKIIKLIFDFYLQDETRFIYKKIQCYFGYNFYVNLIKDIRQMQFKKYFKNVNWFLINNHN